LTSSEAQQGQLKSWAGARDEGANPRVQKLAQREQISITFAPKTGRVRPILSLANARYHSIAFLLPKSYPLPALQVILDNTDLHPAFSITPSSHLVPITQFLRYMWSILRLRFILLEAENKFLIRSAFTRLIAS
jgi:hypothetical protein